jgi:hypothetical protein
MKKLSLIIATLALASQTWAEPQIYAKVTVDGDLIGYFRSSPNLNQPNKRSEAINFVYVPLSKIEHLAGWGALLQADRDARVASGIAAREPKPADLKEAETAYIEYLRDEGYIAPTDTKAPPGLSKQVRKTLISQHRNNPSAPGLAMKTAIFESLIIHVESLGGTLGGAEFHATP